MDTITTRNASMADLVVMLKDQQSRKVDLTTPATTLRASNGDLVVSGSNPVVDTEGVTLTDGRYKMTRLMDEDLAEKLSIPLNYLRKMRETRIDLYDENVNRWLHGHPGLADPDGRSFFLRTFKPDTEGGVGIARALLSNRYQRIDHLDALTAALDGVRQAGANVNITGADLTERRMVVRIEAPEVTAYAPEFLRGYRSPFTGQSGTDNPVVSAGFSIGNSETGDGAFTIVPRMVVQVCSNGLTITKDALRAVHLGGKLDDGVVKWSTGTQQKQLELITAKTTDAVTTFLDVEYMREALNRLSEAAGKPVEKVEEVRDHTKRLGFTEEHIDGVLGYFVQGGQMTMGGITNAITAYAQTVTDGDVAYEMESKATALLTV